jgi:hypothetical protein
MPVSCLKDGGYLSSQTYAGWWTKFNLEPVLEYIGPGWSEYRCPLYQNVLFPFFQWFSPFTIFSEAMKGKVHWSLLCYTTVVLSRSIVVLLICFTLRFETSEMFFFPWRRGSQM